MVYVQLPCAPPMVTEYVFPLGQRVLSSVTVTVIVVLDDPEIETLPTALFVVRYSKVTKLSTVGLDVRSDSAK